MFLHIYKRFAQYKSDYGLQDPKPYSEWLVDYLAATSTKGIQK